MKYIFLFISLLWAFCINAQDTTYAKIARAFRVVSATPTPTPPSEADGYATGTTGGEGGLEYIVFTKGQFQSAVAGSSPKLVFVLGSIDIDYTQIGDSTTIYGLTGAELSGTNRIEGTNVIIRNCILTAPYDGGDQDAVGIAGGTYVWIDHCELKDWTDGAIDCTVGADFITISWCRFYQTTDYVHAFANLVGANDAASGTDAGKLHITIHDNWYDVKVKTRMPRVRFGRVHVYNNYYASYDPPASHSSYITAAIESQILVENNYFENGEDPIEYTSGQNGLIEATGNYFAHAVTGDMVGNDSVFTPPYSYTLQSVMGVKASVMAGAGATL